MPWTPCPPPCPIILCSLGLGGPSCPPRCPPAGPSLLVPGRRRGPQWPASTRAARPAAGVHLALQGPARRRRPHRRRHLPRRRPQGVRASRAYCLVLYFFFLLFFWGKRGRRWGKDGRFGTPKFLSVSLYTHSILTIVLTSPSPRLRSAVIIITIIITPSLFVPFYSFISFIFCRCGGIHDPSPVARTRR